MAGHTSLTLSTTPIAFTVNIHDLMFFPLSLYLVSPRGRLKVKGFLHIPTALGLFVSILLSVGSLRRVHCVGASFVYMIDWSPAYFFFLRNNFSVSFVSFWLLRIGGVLVQKARSNHCSSIYGKNRVVYQTSSPSNNYQTFIHSFIHPSFHQIKQTSKPQHTSSGTVHP
jgi:hypothetical protein